jgi:geranylgeranyl pyrophosphate synthase
LGTSESLLRAAALLDEALSALVPLGPRAEPLRALAHYVLARKK